MPAFIFAVKQYLHLHLLWSHTIICLCNEAVLALFFFHKATSTVFFFFFCIEATSTLHSYRSWANIHFCHEATTTLHLHRCQRSTLHSYRSHEAASTIHFCHEAMTTFHISTEVIPILVFATKPRQHFIHTEAMPTFIFVMKPRQHSTLALAVQLHQYLHWVTSKLHLHRSRANIHETTKSWQHSTLAQIFKGNIA